MKAVRSIPRAGRICFLIALVNAIVWGVVVPPFQAPDETDHFAYAQYLAETGKPPQQRAREAGFSSQEQAAMNGLFMPSVIGNPQLRGVLTNTEDARMRRMLATNPSPSNGGGNTSSSNQPPLYYAFEAVVYRLSPSQNILFRLQLMRLASAFLAALTVLLIFLFLRELMPGSPWSWTMGALAVAFQPTFMFIASGVQGDNLLFCASAATFLSLMRAWRRGLTPKRGAAIGAATVAGVLGKLTFISLVPGIACAVLLLTWRTWPRDRGRALRSAAICAAIVVIPVLLYAVLNADVWHRGGATAGGLAGAATGPLPPGKTVTLRESLDYIWQLYLPKLWFMHHTFFSGYPLWTIWLVGVVGHFGWLDYTFPTWVYTDARWIFYVLLVLAAVGLVRIGWKPIRPLLPLFACFAVSAIGLLAAIGWAGIRYRFSTGYQFEQGRYLFPLLTFYALFIVVALRAVPKQWGPALGALLLVLVMAHGLFAETLTISRYYG